MRRGGPISDEQHFKNVEAGIKRRATKALRKPLSYYDNTETVHLIEDLEAILHTFTHDQLMEVMSLVRRL